MYNFQTATKQIVDMEKSTEKKEEEEKKDKTFGLKMDQYAKKGQQPSVNTSVLSKYLLLFVIRE